MTDRSTGILANPPINQQTDIIVHGDWGSLTSNDKVTLAHWDKAICGLGGEFTMELELERSISMPCVRRSSDFLARMPF